LFIAEIPGTVVSEARELAIGRKLGIQLDDINIISEIGIGWKNIIL
jgi:hypothetical protein